MMNFIYFLILILLLFYSYSSYSHPWVIRPNEFEILVSDTVYFTKIPSTISNAKHFIQKEIAELICAAQNSHSRKKKIQIENNITKLKTENKKLFDDYEIYTKYFNIEYGLKKSKSIGLNIILSKLDSYSNNKLSHHKIFSPYFYYNFYQGKKFAAKFALKLDNIYFNNKNDQLIDLGFSFGSSKVKKKQKHFTYYDFNFSPNNFFKLNIANGVETHKGYSAIISTSYYKSIKYYKDVHSDKIRGEFSIAKKLYDSQKKDFGPSIFINYFSEYSKYSDFTTSSGIQIGFYYK
jgi:hypothetical protein